MTPIEPWVWDGAAVAVVVLLLLGIGATLVLVRMVHRVAGRCYRRWRYGNPATIGEPQ